MALRYANGFEFGSGTGNQIDCTGGTRSNAVVRSGSYSLACGSGVNAYISNTSLSVVGGVVYSRVYMYLSADFTHNADADAYTGPGGYFRWTGTRQLRYWYSGTGGTPTQLGSTSSTIPLQTWVMLEMYYLKGSNGGSDGAAEARVDGVTIASGTNLPNFVGGGLERFHGGTAGTAYFDDLQQNDNSGSVNNSWVGSGYVLSALPVADSQRGSWTGGVGGTTNLWEALNNLPPTGTATETDTTQIESADSSGNNATDEYRGQFNSYDTIGVGSSDTIAGLVHIVSHGEDVATGTKTGSFGFQSNPSSTYGTFTFGSDVGALGTWPTNWFTAFTTVDNPTVTRNQNIITGLRKTDTGTRVASVSFMGIYIAVLTPPPSADPINNMVIGMDACIV